MRLFASLTPPKHVVEHLDSALDSVRTMLPEDPGDGPPALRWVPAELRHITLAFYGEMPTGAVDDLVDGLARACGDRTPLDLRLRGAGVFSSRTLWAGVQDQTPSTHSRRNGPLADLMALCDEVGRGAGSTAERQERRRAHLTLARARGRASQGRGGQGRRLGAPHRGPGRGAHATAGHPGGPEHRRRHPGREHPRAGGFAAAEQLHLLADALAVYEGPVWTAEDARLMVSELGAGPGGGPRHQTLAVLPFTG